MEPVIVQSHILKTAGTALRELINANYASGEVVHTEGLTVGQDAVAGEANARGALVRAWREYYASLPAGEREQIKCFCGHQAQFLIDAIDDRPVRAFCVLRDPVDRVISSYLFMISAAERLPAESPAVQLLDAMRARGWGLAEIYRELAGRSDPREKLEGLDELAVKALVMTFFNGQTRHLLMTDPTIDAMPLETGRAGLDPYSERVHAVLTERYLVGTQDRFSQSVRLFADSFGWRRVFVPRVNVGGLRGGRYESEIDAETRSLIRAYNSVDADLHDHHSRRLAELPEVSRLTDLHAGVRRSAGRARARVRLRKRTPRAS